MSGTPIRRNCTRILRASQTLMTRTGDSGSGSRHGNCFSDCTGRNKRFGVAPQMGELAEEKRRLPDDENWGRAANSSRPSYLPLSNPFS